jgi:hypothetical protein
LINQFKGRLLATLYALDHDIQEQQLRYAKTKGTNLTTKITADKLLQAWKKT